MRVSRTVVERALVGVILVECTLCLGLSTYFALNKPATPMKPQSTAVHVPARPVVAQTNIIVSYPIRLTIPKINVDAALDYVALTSQGALGVPKSPSNVGWYDRGPRPGEKGSSVIDGHFGYKDNVPAVFDKLHLLQQGDNIYVKDDLGMTTAFVVRDVRTLDENQDASNVFISNDEKAHLNLITCQGTWIEVHKSYASRLVVFADKLMPENE
jgi:LPXTG-site transpeptidase (sortase) family protein